MSTGPLPRPRKRFGQHFLADQTIAERIVALVQPLPGELVLEIGPGRGVLTQRLAARGGRLVAVEIDRDLAAYLRQRLAGPDFRLIEGDVLDLDLGQLLREEGRERLLVVGNLPYNITAPLLFGMLAQADHIRAAILMVQQEVARRLAARPGSKDYSLLTVLLSLRAQVHPRIQVAPGAFRPVPQIYSTVVEVQFETARYPVQDERIFGRLVRSAFGQRRKMLRNSLLGLCEGRREELEERAAAADIDLSRRPETLSLEEFGRLSDAFAGARSAAEV
ncbi:MAG: ribosomal RNA small subunit methyltransferase A [Candidatus Latescibacteria bacterium]|nr:ribosomal RNA small subunit methyltransferase A [Candidatus Latescibacterota bacterium]